MEAEHYSVDDALKIRNGIIFDLYPGLPQVFCNLIGTLKFEMVLLHM